MADGKIKISELDEALQLNNDAEFPYSQENGGVQTTYKAPIGQIARKTAESITYTNLTTTAKTLVGAINELKSLGSPILLGTSAPTAQQGANGNLYVQYTEGTGGADDEVDAIFVKIDGAWCEISTGGGGGSGGHTIVDDSGTALTQRTNLQFKGAYSEDNSTDDTTEVNVVRSMTKAQYNQLSAAEKVGLINITDETSQINATEIPMSPSDSDTIAEKFDGLNATNLPIQSGSATNTKDYIDTGLSGKADTSDIPTRSDFIRIDDVTIGTITIGADGYVNISSYRPTIPTGFTLFLSYVATYSDTSTKDGAMTVNAGGDYLNGAPNTTVTGLRVRYVFFKST